MLLLNHISAHIFTHSLGNNSPRKSFLAYFFSLTIMNPFVNIPKFSIWLYALNRVRVQSILSHRPRYLSQLTENIESHPWHSKEGLMRCSANYFPLTPISFLERAAKVFRDRTSVVYGSSVKYTWEETHSRCLKMASALSQLGISRGDVVATLAPNVPAIQELHFAVPMAGAVLCTLNTRHDSTMISVLLRHSEAKIIFVDQQLFEVAQEALDLLDDAKTKPLLVLIPDPENLPPPVATPDVPEYETLLASGRDDFAIRWPLTEFDPISVNYTSGTTSQPKGVVFNHRGAYLIAISTSFVHEMGSMPTYLWTVPMFHCNGWCLIWGVAALGGTNICLRRVCPKDIFENISLHKVTHMTGAPTVLNMIVNSPESDRKPLPHKVVVTTGGSSPSPHILSKMEELGFSISHIYGLTEIHGPGTSCLWRPEWDSLTPDEQFTLRARQGVEHFFMQDVDIRNPDTMEKVPDDGKTLGEIMIRGNCVMSGYLKNLKATEEAFRGGWFHTGDLAVRHPDGYIEVKDRMKDIIISGGENINSTEVERVLVSHPAVLEAAVVARPDDHWGQTPCAFVKLKEGFNVSSQEIINFCRDHLPHYMTPPTVIFEDLPTTSTGKVQKFILREKAKALGSLSKTKE